MNYNVKSQNWNRDAVIVVCLAWEIRTRATICPKRICVCLHPLKRMQAITEIRDEPQKIVCSDRENHIINVHNTSSRCAQRYGRRLSQKFVRQHPSEDIKAITAAPRGASRLGGGHFLRIVSHFSGGFCLGCELQLFSQTGFCIMRHAVKRCSALCNAALLTSAKCCGGFL